MAFSGGPGLFPQVLFPWGINISDFIATRVSQDKWNTPYQTISGWLAEILVPTKHLRFVCFYAHGALLLSSYPQATHYFLFQSPRKP